MQGTPVSERSVPYLRATRPPHPLPLSAGCAAARGPHMTKGRHPDVPRIIRRRPPLTDSQQPCQVSAGSALETSMLLSIESSRAAAASASF
ncbi:hypothetical protein GCM10009716_05360 [Streptomyces sodiiphilus]|uniref:Uncharacterized protein n=1 Tax=Streptomyces sodiiphilus TaxID=226217 RepID=A0ABN2NTF8_9ACTN